MVSQPQLPQENGVWKARSNTHHLTEPARWWNPRSETNLQRPTFLSKTSLGKLGHANIPLWGKPNILLSLASLPTWKTHPAKLSNARVIHPSTSQQLSQFTWACGLIGQRVPSLPNCVRKTYPLTKSTASEPFRSTSVLGRENENHANRMYEYVQDWVPVSRIWNASPNIYIYIQSQIDFLPGPAKVPKKN